VMVLIPLVSHSLELLVHTLRGTPKIVTSLIASVCFTWISTLFNLYAMRRGVLVVESGSKSLKSDLRKAPRLILDFVIVGPIALYRWIFQAKLRRAEAAARSSEGRCCERKQYS